LIDPLRVRKLEDLMATWKKLSAQEIIRTLHQVDRLATQGSTVAEICRQVQLAAPAYDRCRKRDWPPGRQRT